MQLLMQLFQTVSTTPIMYMLRESKLTYTAMHKSLLVLVCQYAYKKLMLLQILFHFCEVYSLKHYRKSLSNTHRIEFFKTANRAQRLQLEHLHCSVLHQCRCAPPGHQRLVQEVPYRTKEGLEGCNMEPHSHYRFSHPKVYHLSTQQHSMDSCADLTHSSSHYPQRKEVVYLLESYMDSYIQYSLIQ